MPKLKSIILLPLVACCLLLSGCWDYADINSTAIVSGLALDKREDGYDITMELVDVSSPESTLSGTLITSSGPSISHALALPPRLISKELFLGHTQIIILGEEVARDNIHSLFDLLLREEEIYPSITLLISHEHTASEILNAQAITSDISSHELDILPGSDKLRSSILTEDLFNIIHDMEAPGLDAVAPAVRLITSGDYTTPCSDGLAVFRDKSLAGFLPYEASQYFMLASGKAQSGILGCRTPAGDVIISITGCDASISPYFNGEEIRMTITMDVTAHLQESSLPPGSSYTLDEIEKMCADVMSEQIMGVVYESFRIGSDIFGFGNRLFRQDPELFYSLGSDYPSRLTYAVDCKINLIDSGAVLGLQEAS